MKFYLSDYNRKKVIQLPIPPSEIKVKRSQNNETFETVSYGELRYIGLLGLYSLGISSFFPSVSYPFSKNKKYFGMEYVNIIEKWRETREPLRLVISEININMPITIDDFEYGIQDGTKDIFYSLSITEYKEIKVIKRTPIKNFRINLKGNVQDIGIVTSTGLNSCMIGTTGKSKRLEMFSMTIDGIDVKYKVHMQDYGDTSLVNEGSQVGSIGKSRRLEGIQINVINIPSGYKLQYRAHVENIGWTGWTESGQFCGTRGKGLRVEAIEVRICSI